MSTGPKTTGAFIYVYYRSRFQKYKWNYLLLAQKFTANTADKA